VLGPCVGSRVEEVAIVEVVGEEDGHVHGEGGRGEHIDGSARAGVIGQVAIGES
jgi:hypothetical protein